MASWSLVSKKVEHVKLLSDREGIFYHMFASPADASGNYGVQLWFHSTLHVKMSAWEVVTPRIFKVDGTSGRLNANIQAVSAHALHELESSTKKNAFGTHCMMS